MEVDTYDALVDAIEAKGAAPTFVVGERRIQVRGVELLCYALPPPRQHGFNYNVEIRCGAQWSLAAPYRTEAARTAFFTALADVLAVVALVEAATAPLRAAA